jgi:hypothetical protein
VVKSARAAAVDAESGEGGELEGEGGGGGHTGGGAEPRVEVVNARLQGMRIHVLETCYLLVNASSGFRLR